MTLRTLVAHLRMCSDMLADVDCWETFYPAVNVVCEVIEELRPQPYVGSKVPLPPGQLLDLIGNGIYLKNCQISICSFLGYLDSIIARLEDVLARVKAQQTLREMTKWILMMLYTKTRLSFKETQYLKSIELLYPNLAEEAKKEAKPP